MTLSLVVMLGAVALAYGPVMRDLVQTWLTVPYYSYGALVPAFTAFALWDGRRDLGRVWRTRARPRASLTAIALVVAGATAFAVGACLGSLSLTALSLPVVLAAVARVALGREGLAVVAFPVAFLALMAPLPDRAIDALSLPMQQIAAGFTEAGLRVLRVPVTRDGLFLHLRGLTVHVTEACNGLRFLFAMTVVGVAVAWATQRTWRGRTAVVLLALVTAVVANMIRVLVTAVVGEYVGPWAAMGTAHVLYGKIVYLGMLAPFALGVLVIRRACEPSRTSSQAGAPAREPTTSAGTA